MQKVQLYTRQNGSRKYQKISSKASFKGGNFPPEASCFDPPKTLAPSPPGLANITRSKGTRQKYRRR
jgi:hypothetical protein